MIGKIDSDSLLSALQLIAGDVKELLLTIKSGKCLSSCHISVLAQCKYVD